MIPSKINTLGSSPEVQIKEKGSVFIASGFRVNSSDEVNDHLKEIKKKYFDASHHCFAYRLADGSLKYSDDGEPSGTAGLRILNAIDHFHLTNVVVIVTRYFGGVKLGVRHLGKAYYLAAESSLSSSEIVTLTSYSGLKIKVEFDQISQMHKLLHDSGAKIVNVVYSEDVEFECLVKMDLVEDLSAKIIEFTRGNAKILLSSDNYLI